MGLFKKKEKQLTIDDIYKLVVVSQYFENEIKQLAKDIPVQGEILNESEAFRHEILLNQYEGFRVRILKIISKNMDNALIKIEDDRTT